MLLPQPDHPRGCGENCMWGWYVSVTGGSPPQVRGKLPTSDCKSVDNRITPAGAGKTDRRDIRYSDKKDHPRRCGENRPCMPRQITAPGSPPRMRGKPYISAARRRRHKITPADAGKTRTKLDINSCTSDHPRGCGENSLISV